MRFEGQHAFFKLVTGSFVAIKIQTRVQELMERGQVPGSQGQQESGAVLSRG